jgi:hypothetical protein
MAASAAIHSFATPMIYYKFTTSAQNYAVFMPPQNMFNFASPILYLDLGASGTAQSWAYGVGNSVAAAAAGGGAAWSASNSISYTNDLGQTVSTANLNWYGGDSIAMSLGFTQYVTVSSEACGLSFSASLNSADVLSFASVQILPTDWSSATSNINANVSAAASYAIVTSTAAGSLYLSTWSKSVPVLNYFSSGATASLPTFAYTGAYVNVYSSGGAIATSLASSLSALTASIIATGPGSGGVANYNKCIPAYTQKSGLNSAGTVIGGQAGMLRLW